MAILLHAARCREAMCKTKACVYTKLETNKLVVIESSLVCCRTQRTREWSCFIGHPAIYPNQHLAEAVRLPPISVSAPPFSSHSCCRSAEFVIAGQEGDETQGGLLAVATNQVLAGKSHAQSLPKTTKLKLIMPSLSYSALRLSIQSSLDCTLHRKWIAQIRACKVCLLLMLCENDMTMRWLVVCLPVVAMTLCM